MTDHGMRVLAAALAVAGDPHGYGADKARGDLLRASESGDLLRASESGDLPTSTALDAVAALDDVLEARQSLRLTVSKDDWRVFPKVVFP